MRDEGYYFSCYWKMISSSLEGGLLFFMTFVRNEGSRPDL